MKKLIVLFLLVTFNSYASDAVPEMNDKNGYVAPFKMFDNVYYVGDKWVSSYAIETSEGLVIIDTLDFPYSKWIPINLSKLGLEDKKVTHIFVTHGHSWSLMVTHGHSWSLMVTQIMLAELSTFSLIMVQRY